MKKLLSLSIILVVTILLLNLCFATPVKAETNQDTVVISPIIIDGKKIFEVHNSGEFTAQQRANEANKILAYEIKKSQEPIDVSLDLSQELPIIRVNQKHLLTVTLNDLIEGKNLIEQAQIWEEQLDSRIKQAQQERTLAYIIKAILLSIVYLTIALLISWQFRKFFQRWIERIVVTEPISGADTNYLPSLNNPTIWQVVIKIVQGFILLISIFFIGSLFPQTRQLAKYSINIITTSLVANIFSLGNKSYSVLDLLILIGLFICLFILAKTIRTIFQSRVLSIAGLSRADQEIIGLIANYTIIFIGTIIVLQLWGLDISSLTVFAGVLGVGIGFGLQGITKDFISGLVIIFERPIQVGDFVTIGNSMGTVEKINFRSTEVRTLDQVSVIFPNSRFLESEVINWSHKSPISRLKIPINVAYGSDLNAVKNALIDSVQEYPDILSSPSPKVLFTGFGDSSLNFNLLIWINKPHKQFQISSDIYFQIDALFRERNIEIPFPQRDLHLRSSDSISPQLFNNISELSKNLSVWLNNQNHSSNIEKQDQ